MPPSATPRSAREGAHDDLILAVRWGLPDSGREIIVELLRFAQGWG